MRRSIGASFFSLDIELNVEKIMKAEECNPHEIVRDQVRKLKSVGGEYVVLVVRDPECLPPDVSDRLLNPLESEKWSNMSVLIFLASDRQTVNPQFYLVAAHSNFSRLRLRRSSPT